MRKLALGLMAAGTLGVATIAPAAAQVGVYAGPGGFGVELGAPGYYYGPAPYAGYYAYAPEWNGYRHYRHPGWHDRYVHGYRR